MTVTTPEPEVLLPSGKVYTTILALSLASGTSYAKRSEACVEAAKAGNTVIRGVKGSAAELFSNTATEEEHLWI